jgi:hypothetical protein
LPCGGVWGSWIGYYFTQAETEVNRVTYHQLIEKYNDSSVTLDFAAEMLLCGMLASIMGLFGQNKWWWMLGCFVGIVGVCSLLYGLFL